jgi:hypothetical protein
VWRTVFMDRNYCGAQRETFHDTFPVAEAPVLYVYVGVRLHASAAARFRPEVRTQERQPILKGTI